ncbi:MULTISPECIES: polyketide cyclase [unclassified Streptomyces]|uniref:polyketide cyclase n=1 Tax=unclassified Streptomyces TaxID=2593676 RepID=UPI003829655B
MTAQTVERLEVSREIAASPAQIFGLLCSPEGHVAIDSSGMLQAADGEAVRRAGDSFVVHMDREALGDRPMGRYDVTVVITRFTADSLIEWTPVSPDFKPDIDHRYGYRLVPTAHGTQVTSYYDWSQIHDRYRAANIFPLLQESSLRATLGILARTVERSAPSLP